jgi:hypothetical protein
MGRIVAFCVFLTVSISGVAYGQSLPPLLRYDNFNQKFLDPNKWAVSSPCFTWTVLDCVREIQNGQLRLAVRGFGATDSNQGSQYAESELHFLRPSTIKSIATDLVLRRLNGPACAANTEPPGGHAILQGTFFNSGTGDSNDDVQGLLLIDNRSPSVVPGVADVCSMLHWQGQFFDGVCLGRINVGQKIKAQLTWDQSNHRFLSSFTDLTTGVVAQESMTYSMSDTRPAAAPDQLIGVRVWEPNCVGKQGLASDIEATFDNVMVGTSAHED